MSAPLSLLVGLALAAPPDAPDAEVSAPVEDSVPPDAPDAGDSDPAEDSDPAGASAAPVRSPPEIPAPPWPDRPEVQTFTLSNGAEVQIWERHELPLVRIELSVTWPGYGATLEEQLSAGLASGLLEAGTRRRSGGALSTEMDRLGADWDLGMNYSRVWADVEVPVGAEAEALDLMLEALTRSRYSRREARRSAQRWADWRDSLPDDLYRVHERGVNHVWFPDDHPVRHRARGEEIRALRARDARALVEGVLEDGRALIVVVGDTTPEQILPLLEARYGTLGGQTGRDHAPPAEGAPGVWLVDTAGFDVAEISLLAPAPPLGDPELPALQLTVGLFAGHFTSRLGQDLRETRGLTYGVSGGVEAWSQVGRVRIDTEVQLDRAGEALGAAAGQLERLCAEGPTAAELERARNTLRVESATPTLAGGAALLGNLWMNERDLDALEDARALADAVTPEQAQAVAERWLDPEGVIWVVTGDRRALEPQLEALGWTVSRVVTAETLSAER